MAASRFLLVGLMSGLLSMLNFGCTYDDDDYRDRDRDVDGEVIISGERDADVEVVTSGDRIRAVPSRAVLVREGEGELSYRAEDDGVLYVMDRDEDRVVFSARVRRNEQFGLFPSDDRVTIDGRKVLDYNLRAGHRYAIYFDRRGDWSDGGLYDREVVLRVPRRAVVVEEGTGELRYRAHNDGTLYVYDVDDERIVYSGHLHEGNRFEFDPREDRATIDGRVIFERDLSTRHRYRLYFDRD